MRIITIGELAVELKHTCVRCKTIFAYTRYDCTGDGYNNAVQCPLCRAWNHGIELPKELESNHG